MPEPEKSEPTKPTASLSAELRRAQRRLDQKISHSLRLIALENIWPRLWLPATVIGLFLLVTTLGLWKYLPPGLHKAGLIFFAGGFILSLLSFFAFKFPGRDEAVRRLEKSSGLPHRPVTSFEDDMIEMPSAPNEASEPNQTLWLTHKLRQARKFTALKTGQFNAKMERYDPYALRAVMLLGLVTAFVATGKDFKDNLAYAVAFKAPIPPTAHIRLDAWINPPVYTGKPPILLSEGTLKPTPARKTSLKIAEKLDRASERLRTNPAQKNGKNLKQQTVRSPESRDIPTKSRLVLRLNGAGHNSYKIRFSRNGIPFTPQPSAQNMEKPSTNFDESTVNHNKGDVFQTGIVLTKPTRVEILRGGKVLKHWQFNIIRDNPPAIALIKPPLATHRGALRLEYRVADDYGVKSAEALFTREQKTASQTGAKRNKKAKTSTTKRVKEEPLFPAPQIALRIPRDKKKRGNGRTYKSLASHPWAGLPVIMTLQATDFAGQTGKSSKKTLNLPERMFKKPLARAVIALRKKLVSHPASRFSVAARLTALTSKAQRAKLKDLTVFLGLRTAVWRLRYDGSKVSTRTTVKLLWDMAVRIEDGDLSDTERALRSAQERLMDALARNAPAEEIKRLMKDLRQALAAHLRQMTKNAGKNKHPELARQQQNTRTMQAQDFDQILKNIENLAKIGARDKAQQMLSQLRDMLERLQSQKAGSKGGKGTQQMMKAINGLGKMIMKQQKLLDGTFALKRKNDQEMFRGLTGNMPNRAAGQRSQKRSQSGPSKSGKSNTNRGANGKSRRGGGAQPGPAPGQQAGQRPGQGQSQSQGQGNGRGENGQTQGQNPGGSKPSGHNGPPSLGALAGGQENLRNSLVDTLSKLQNSGTSMPKGLKGAAGAMGRAGEALQDQELGFATQQQSRALSKLRKGTQKLAEQLLKAMRGKGGGQGRESYDPAGRPTAHNGPSFGLNVKVPDEIVMQRAREILEELRKRLSDPSRPAVDLDYIERLIKRF